MLKFAACFNLFTTLYQWQRLFSVVMLFFWSSVAGSVIAQPGGTQAPAVSVSVRMDLGLGDGVQNYQGVILLRTDAEPSGQGSATHWPPSVNTRTNCDGDPYGNAVVNMDENWIGAVRQLE